MLFGIGGFELFLILIFGFLIFGPDKLPEIAKTVGKAIAKFRNAQEEMKGQLSKESFIDKDSENPFKNPIEVIENAASNAQDGIKDARHKADQATDKLVGAATAINSASKERSDESRSMSFAERKAAYEKERAARLARSEQDQNNAGSAKNTHEDHEPEANLAQKKPSSADDDAKDSIKASDNANSNSAGSASVESPSTKMEVK